MKICNDGHPDIVHNGEFCPLCTICAELKDTIIDQLKEIKTCNDQIKYLGNINTDQRKQLTAINNPSLTGGQKENHGK